MDPTSPPLKRSLFGYRRDDVAQLLEDREAALRAAQERAASAGARLGDLDTELRSLRERLEERDRELEGQKRDLEERSRDLEERKREGEERKREIEGRDRELADVKRRLEESDARTAELAAEAVTLRERGEAAESIAREFDGIVDAAEAAAASVLERIRQSVHEELAEVQREHERASEENARIDRWREGLDETLRSLDARLASARADAEDAPRILSEALAPLHRSLADAGAEVSAVRDALAARDEATASAEAGALPDVAEGPSLEEAVSVHEEEADIVISTDQPEDASDDASHNAGWSSRA
jgi:chromosome segregation protein